MTRTQAERVAKYDAELKRANAEVRALNVKIGWTNLQLFWHLGYGPVALAVTLAFIASKVL